MQRPRLDGCRNRPDATARLSPHQALFQLLLADKTPALPPANVCPPSLSAKTAQGTLSNTGTHRHLPAASGLSSWCATRRPRLGRRHRSRSDQRLVIIEEDRTFYVIQVPDHSTDPAAAGSCAAAVQSWAITSTRLTCNRRRGLRRRGLVRAGQSFGAVQLRACDVGTALPRRCQKTPLIRAPSISTRPSAITLHPPRRRRQSDAGWFRRPIETSPEFSGSLRCRRLHQLRAWHWRLAHAMAAAVSGALIAAGQTTIRVPLEQTPLRLQDYGVRVRRRQPAEREHDAGGPPLA